MARAALLAVAAVPPPGWAGRRIASVVFALALAAALAGVAVAPDPLRVAIVLIVSPLIEEAVFRAGLQDSLMRYGIGAWASNAWTALLFTAVHVALRPGDPFALAVGLPALAIGVLYARQRSVRLCAAVHMMMNMAWLQLGLG